LYVQLLQWLANYNSDFLLSILMMTLVLQDWWNSYLGLCYILWWCVHSGQNYKTHQPPNLAEFAEENSTRQLLSAQKFNFAYDVSYM